MWHGFGIDIKGTNVIVKIVKAKEQPEIINNTDYCDIVAKKAGIISNIIAQNGTAVVNIGDSVNIGDVLIQGIMEGKYTEPRKVHSLGIVEAEIVYGKTKEIKFVDEEYKKTGRKENKYEINYKDKKLKLYKNLSKFEHFKTESNHQNIRLFKNFFLPISITKITNIEEIKKTKNISLEEAINIAVEELTIELEDEIPSKERIIDKKVSTVEQENSVIVTLNYKVIEEIGENKKN